MDSKAEATIFMTGGTGLIGKWALTFLTKNYRVLVLARNAKRRQQPLSQWVDARGGNSQNLQLLNGDLAEPRLGLSALDWEQAVGAQYIYHLGAAFDWSLSREYAHQVTVAGSEQLLALAASMTQLRQIVHLTGFMLAAPHVWKTLGLDPEMRAVTAELTPQQSQRLYQRFSPYEAAKIQAHFTVSHGAEKLGIPLTNIELSSVAGHSQSGELGQAHGIELLLAALWRKRLPAIPGGADHWLPIVAVDYVAEFISQVIAFPESLGQSYIVLDEQTPNLPQMIRHLCAGLDQSAPRLRLPKWLVTMGMNLGAERWVQVPVETLQLVQPYRYDTSNTLALAQQFGLAMPSAVSVLEKTAQHWKQQHLMADKALAANLVT